jgi:spermidine synthase
MPQGVLYLLFFFSGCTGLIYELVWTRKLVLLLGGTTYAITTVLVAFMSGLALGSYLAGRISDRLRQPGRAYGLLELGIGLYVLAVPALMHLAEPMYRTLYPRVADQPWVLTGLRFAVGCIVLVVPTTCMGATLPLLVRYLTGRGGTFGRSVGVLYGINTLGAVAGTVLAGFWLLPQFGQTTTTWIAATVNLAIGLTAVTLLRTSATRTAPPDTAPAGEPDARPAGTPPADVQPPLVPRRLRRTAVAGFAVSGFAAMVYQIAWTRALILSLGSSTYAFTCILAAFILGLAVGSLIVSRWADRVQRPAELFGLLELGIAVSAMLIVPIHGRVPIIVEKIVVAEHAHFTYMLSLQFLIVIGVTLVPTLLMGAIFPIATRVVAAKHGEIGAAVGRAYAVNTVGTIVGSFLAGFVMIRSDVLGVQHSIVAAAVLNAGVGIALVWQSQARGAPRPRRLVAAALMAASVPVIALLAGRWSRELLSSAPFYRVEREAPDMIVLDYAEGVDTTVAVLHEVGLPYHVTLTVNGKPDASTAARDMSTQILISQIPALLCPGGRSACVIGLGSGVTAGSVLTHPSYEHIDCVEISAEVVRAERFFADYNHDVLNQTSRVNVIRADGRNHLLLTDRTYDIIISEPSNPWISGAASLFTREFFAVCRDRLNDGGRLCVWLQGYAISYDDFRMVVNTLASVFDSISVWQSADADIMLIASKTSQPVPLDRFVDTFHTPSVHADLCRIGITTPGRLLGRFITADGPLLEWAAGTPLHTDDRMQLEFSAPKSVYRPTELMRILDDLAARPVPLTGTIITPSADRARTDRILKRAAAAMEARRRALEASRLYGDNTLQFATGVLSAYELDPGNSLVYLGFIVPLQQTFEESSGKLSPVALAVANEVAHARLPTMTPPGGRPVEQVFFTVLGNARNAMKRRQWNAAADYAVEASEMRPDHVETIATLGRALAMTGRTAQAAHRLDAFLDRHPDQADVLLVRAAVAASARHTDAALEFLERALHTGRVLPASLRTEAMLAPLRNDPRFQTLLARHELPGTPPPSSAPASQPR